MGNAHAGLVAEQTIGEHHSLVEAFAENLPVLAEAQGGIPNLRQLALRLAFQGRFTDVRRRLVPAIVRGTHEALGVSKGRDATTTILPGDSALAVGPADMQIPEGWDWLPLVAVAQLESGHTPSRSHRDYWDGGIPWLGIRDAKIHNYGWIDATEQTVSEKGLANSSARLLPAGTVCLSRTASVGYVTIMKRPMATSQDFVNWVCGKRLLPEYLMQLLRCEVPVLKRFSKGAVHQTIYFPEVKAFHISLPPLGEQRRIVAKVDELMRLIDDLEAKQAKKRETQARLRTAALDALTSAEGPGEFEAAWKRVEGDFGVLFERAGGIASLRQAILDLAVRGCLVNGRGDAVAPDAGLVTKGDDDPFALPAHWRWTSFGDLCDDITVGHVGSMATQYVETGVPFLRSLNVGEFRFVADGLKHVGQAFHRELKKSALKGGEILAVRSGNVGRSCVFPPELAPANCSDLVIFRPGGRLDPHYGCIVINSPYGRAHVLSEKVGIAQGHFNVGSAKLMPTPLPPLAEQRRIVEKVNDLMGQCDDLEAKLHRAEATASKLAESVVAAIVA
ncbi:MAG: restriction endonuclease subunit S [Deltaproteobacteria bacterium]